MKVASSRRKQCMYFPKKLFLLVILIFFIPGAAFSSVTMPEFSLPSVTDGKTVTSKTYEGKVLLVTFFATWCRPCRQEIPTLIKLQQEYADKGFSIVALSVDESGPSVVAKMMIQEKISYPVLMADRATADNFGGIAGIPTSFLVNRKGHVVKRYTGFVPHALLENDIKAVL